METANAYQQMAPLCLPQKKGALQRKGQPRNNPHGHQIHDGARLQRSLRWRGLDPQPATRCNSPQAALRPCGNFTNSSPVKFCHRARNKRDGSCVPYQELFMLKKCVLLVLLPTLSVAFGLAQNNDPDYAASVKEWTTRHEFMSPLVDHLPKSSTVPSPKDVLGYYIGAPKKLTYYADVLRYYRTLAAKSPRVKVINIGKTEEGRDLVMVFGGSEDSIKNLDT